MSEEKKYKDEKVSPFVWVDSLCTKVGDPMEEHGEEAYPAFMINRAMSQYQDCIFHAAEINLYPNMDNRMAHDYYRTAIRAAKRYGKWGKKKNVGDVSLLMEHYQINRERAEETLRLLTPEQLVIIRTEEKAKES
jgi:hypothetical protein